ncbi:MAG: sulfatase-like hydrolase/transferase [Rubrivivax sp.]
MPASRRKLLITGAAAATSGAGAAVWLSGRGDGRRGPGPVLAAVDGFPARLRQVAAGAGSPLNVLLIVTDQERADLPAALPLPGHERLRERGITFTNWHVHTTPCSPSRSNLYFGQHTQHTRMNVNLGLYPEPAIPDAMPSLGHYFRANGWRTTYKGKWHLSELRAHYELTYGHYPNSRDALEPFGFSDFNFDGDPHGATWTGYKFDAQIAAEAAHWLHTAGRAARSAGQPWLLAVNFVNPHDVMYFATGAAQQAGRRHRDYLAPLAPAPVDPLYARAWGLPLPANRGDDLARKPWAHANYREFCDMAYGPVPAAGVGPDAEAAWQAYQDYYFNCIRDADRHLVTVLDALEASGQAGRTVVVFTSDHGEMAGAHGLRQKGPFVYQENVRVPFVVRPPDLRAGGGAQTAALGGAVDLIPTLLELAGVPAARVAERYPQLRGHSVAAAVADPAARTRRDEQGVLFNYNTTHYLDSAFAGALAERGIEADRWMPLRALAAGQRPLPRLTNPALFRGIHTGRHKFVRYFRPDRHHRPDDWDTLVAHNQLELYDLQADPQEMVNLAHAPAQADAATKALILGLNARTNALVAAEVGEDLGDELPGPAFMKRL